MALTSKGWDFCGSQGEEHKEDFRRYMQELTEYILSNDTAEVEVEEGDLGWNIPRGVRKILFTVFNPAA